MTEDGHNFKLGGGETYNLTPHADFRDLDIVAVHPAPRTLQAAKTKIQINR